MDLDATHSVELSGSDLMTLRAGLRAYLRAFEQHREGDQRGSHPDAEWERFQRHVGELIWRLEEVGVDRGTTVVHSAEAVEP
jgi:hypothetical protein